MATDPAGAVKTISPGSDFMPHGGFFRRRWLPGTRRVAPLSDVKSSIIQTFCVVSGQSGNGSDN